MKSEKRMKISKYYCPLFLLYTVSVLHSSEYNGMQINQIGAAPIVDKYKENIEVGNSSIEVQEDSNPNENHNHQSIVNLNKLGLSGPINTDNYQTIYTFEN